MGVVPQGRQQHSLAAEAVKIGALSDDRSFDRHRQAAIASWVLRPRGSSPRAGHQAGGAQLGSIHGCLGARGQWSPAAQRGARQRQIYWRRCAGLLCSCKVAALHGSGHGRNGIGHRRGGRRCLGAAAARGRRPHRLRCAHQRRHLIRHGWLSITYRSQINPGTGTRRDGITKRE